MANPGKKKNNNKKKKKTMSGRGDYTSEVKSIKDPIRKLDAKLDHLEAADRKSVV